jgi:uncharacterized protein (TIGR00369 family)
VTAPCDPRWEERVRREFAQQRFMATLGAELSEVGPGAATVTCGHDGGLTQQHGFVHAGVLVTLADTAAGFAALSLMPADREVLTADLTVHLLRPALGARFVARARTVKNGRTLTVCRAEVTGDAVCAIATVSLAAVAGRQPRGDAGPGA